MNYIKKLAGNKKFRHGTFSALSALIAVAVFIMANLVFSKLGLKYDLTENKLYTLTDETKDILQGIDEPIILYALYPTGEEIPAFKEILEQYPIHGKNIKIEYKDPYLYPQFVESYATGDESVSPQSVIVQSDKRYKIVYAEDMLTYSYNYDSYQQELSSIDIEPQITNAIKYVSDDSAATIYAVSGHNEVPIHDSLVKLIENANFQYKELDLFLAETVPEDCDILLVTTPGRDWTENEAKTVKDYLEKDGRAMFFIDYLTYDMTNLESVLTAYGIELGKAIIAEGEGDNFYGNPYYLLPLNQNHTITSTLSSGGYRTLLPLSRNIEIISVRRNSLVFEPLLSTSGKAYGKTNPDSQSVNKEEGDLTGPFNLSIAATDSYADGQATTKLVVTGTSAMLDIGVIQYIGGSNADFFINAANWLYDKPVSVYIRSKAISGESLVMSVGESNTIAVLSIIFIPAAIFASGVGVWLRRRNR